MTFLSFMSHEDLRVGFNVALSTLHIFSEVPHKESLFCNLDCSNDAQTKMARLEKGHLKTMQFGGDLKVPRYSSSASASKRTVWDCQRTKKILRNKANISAFRSKGCRFSGESHWLITECHDSTFLIQKQIWTHTNKCPGNGCIYPTVRKRSSENPSSQPGFCANASTHAAPSTPGNQTCIADPPLLWGSAGLPGSSLGWEAEPVFRLPSSGKCPPGGWFLGPCLRRERVGPEALWIFLGWAPLPRQHCQIPSGPGKAEA